MGTWGMATDIQTVMETESIDMAPLAISAEFSPPRSAYFCCPKCGDEVFIIREYTVFSDRSVTDMNIHFCNTCKKQEVFEKYFDFSLAKSWILKNGLNQALSIG